MAYRAVVRFAAAVFAGFRGGDANNTSNDGLGYVNVNNAVGNANDNIGARLAAFTLGETPYRSSPDPRRI